MNFISNILQKFNTKTFNNGGYRQDKEQQESIRNAIEKGKTVSVKGVQSSRYQYDKSNTLYDPNDVAQKDIDAGNTDAKVRENSVSSTAIDSVKYNPKTQDLDVKFVNGKKYYNYPDVPEDVFTEFMDAPSKGRYMAQVISPEYSINK